MDIKILDRKFKLVRVIDDFYSLIWHRKYYECGMFQLYLGIEYFEEMRNAKYIYIEGKKETGVVESFGYSDEEGAFLSGRFLECIYDNCIIYPEQRLTGAVEEVMVTLSQKFLPQISSLKSGELSEDEIEFQNLGSNLMDKLYEIGKTSQLSYRVRYDYLKDNLEFRVYRGLDRAGNSLVNTHAVFSKDYENVIKPKYSCDMVDYRNYAYVAGEEKDTGRIVTMVDQRINQADPKREIWIDAKNLKMENLNQQTYIKLLKQKGLEELASHNMVEKVDMELVENAGLKYQEDYDLGDKCIYIDRLAGLEVEQRITEVLETYEAENHSISVKFGEDEKTIRQKIKRSER
jgi:hypothetical protein